MNEEMQRLQSVEQSLHASEVQKQSTRGELVEVESALAELEKTDDAYRIVGNIMVKTDKSQLKEELDERLAVLKNRLSTVEKQEERLRNEAKGLQEELMKSMGEKHE